MTQTPSLDQIRKLPFFFILGRPRSGTTLLRTLLDAHPNINIPLENSGMIHLYFKYRRVGNWDRRILHSFLDDFRNLHYIGSWNLDWDSIRALSDQVPGGELAFHEAIRVLYFHYLSEFSKEEILCLGDKSPLNSLYSKDLYHAFPGAKYIHLVRDYRANLASMSKHDIFSPSSTVILMQWKKSVTQIDRLAREDPEHFLQVRYEDLVLDPVNTFGTICDFLGVKFSAELLDPGYRQKALRKIYDASFLNQWHPNLSARITTSSIHKWESELSAASVRKADYIAGRTGERFKYFPRNRRFGAPFILLTELKKLFFHLNEMNRYLYDRLPYRMKARIRNRKFILSYRLLQFARTRFGRH